MIVSYVKDFDDATNTGNFTLPLLMQVLSVYIILQYVHITKSCSGVTAPLTLLHNNFLTAESNSTVTMVSPNCFCDEYLRFSLSILFSYQQQ